MRLFVASVVGLFAVAFAPASAGAAQRWASPTSAQTSGACLAVDPCTLFTALDGATTGDEVVLESGRYVMAAPLTARARVTLRGAGPARPVIVGYELSEDDAVLTFRTGGTLRHLEIQAARGQQDALELQGGVAEDLVLTAAGGNGARIFTSGGGTVVRDVLARSAVQNDSDRAALRLKQSGGPGEITLHNVTALAPGANGIRCEVNNGTVTIVNTLARGAKDIKAAASSHCTASFSNFRTALSPNLVAGTGNQHGDPLLDADGHPLVGSPTIDAGTTDSSLGTTDLAGCPRTLGGAPDIGAYEYTPGACAEPPVEEAPPVGEAPPAAPVPPVTAITTTSAPAPDTVAELPPGVPAPTQGSSMVVSPQGTVRVRQPGTNRFVELEAGAQIPLGSEIDATKGRVTLVTAVAGGLQDGTFWGGRFAVRQDAKGEGMTSLVLKGGSFKGCPKTERASAAASSKKKKPVRKLWSKDKNGRFRTHGHNSVATARGTNWLTEDTCAGTRTRVLEGAVAVRNLKTTRTTLVKAGQSFLVRRR
ncbi:hypothetical protein OJ997_22860 [Solirubrobacter phytolaccae]|uniref:Right handed beta helix domain-containing protein n=1 Tax=Solirubrobacter phytolaccae TaxID=1404360 RepID=A0A9X3S9A1_9ACTN|nr:choice-of-anchor Q domain-containing protein [Solirubrobacter phytolaccae]MDA0183169.1 hypothetical protein [Solirubrobacter phytolaccae]